MKHNPSDQEFIDMILHTSVEEFMKLSDAELLQLQERATLIFYDADGVRKFKPQTPRHFVQKQS
jgi:hypothetical protein